MDARVLLASLALSVLSALFCGLAPALQSTRADLVNGLKAADVDVPGRKRLWGRNALVVAQVSMSLMLLTASFLMFRGFHNSLQEGIGFAKERGSPADGEVRSAPGAVRRGPDPAVLQAV